MYLNPPKYPLTNSALTVSLHMPLLGILTLAHGLDRWEKKDWRFFQKRIEIKKKEVRYQLVSALIIPWFWLDSWTFCIKTQIYQLAWSIILLLAFMWQSLQGRLQNAIHSLKTWTVLEFSISSASLRKTLETKEKPGRSMITPRQHSNNHRCVWSKCLLQP